MMRLRISITASPIHHGLLTMPTPIVKALIEGKPPGRRLFIPLIFTLAAKLEDVPLPNFMVNPTKITNGLVALYHRLLPDGITCYFDLLLLAEALGCQLNWQANSPVFERPTREAALNMLQQPPRDIKQRGRLPVALEVVHRVQVTLRNGPVLVVGLPGPLRIMEQLFGQDMWQDSTFQEDGRDSFERLVEIMLPIAQAFCLAGADLLYFNEPTVPLELLSDWEAMMIALWKTIRFHGALPVLSTPQPPHFEDQANAPLLCLKAALGEQTPLPERPFALALPVLGDAIPEASRWIQVKQCALVTTDGEIPYQLEIQKLEQRVAALRSLCTS
jgi:hypothetical protein